MLYQDVLNQCPSHWLPMDNTVRYTLVNLNRYSQEYQAQAQKFQMYQDQNDIYRVQNPLLHAKFIHKQEDFMGKTGCEVVTAFHDTAEVSVPSICEWNLDWRWGERNMFGPGVYFSTRPQDAMRHSNKKFGPYRALIMFDLLIGKSLVVNGEVFLPPLGFDTILAHNNQTYIKYFDTSEFYPTYVTYYNSGL